MSIRLKKNILLILLGLLCVDTSAQILPVEGDSLNYRIVGFRVPEIKGTKSYIVEIAEGNFDKRKAFTNEISITAEDSIHELIAKVPHWAAAYTWRVRYLNDKRKETDATPLYHFTTLYTRFADTSKNKTLVLTKAEKYKDMLIIQDYAPVMYDMDGELVWFIPEIPNVIGEGRGLRNVQPTHTGTFTMQTESKAYEFDYHGRLVFQIPNKAVISDDSVEHFHHDFKKLQNGDYLIASTENIIRPIPKDADTSRFKNDNTIFKKQGEYYKKIESPTLLRYDTNGKVVWYWKASEHLKDEEYFAHRLDDAFLSTPHLNSFYFLEDKNLIYLSYRNYNRVVKMEYPSGKVLANYEPPTLQYRSDVMFWGQHNVSVTDDGLIYMFDNNTDRRTNTTSHVRIFRENIKNNTLDMIWSFSCDIDTFAEKCGVSGGSVYMLKDRDILVSTGSSGRSFIVSYDKQILWNFIAYRKDPSKEVWHKRGKYRTRCIENIDSLRKFIFK